MTGDAGVKRILIVTASRSCTDRSLFLGALATYRVIRPGACLYIGDGTGGDSLARHEWSRLCGYGDKVSRATAAGWLRVFNADWLGPCRPDCEPGHRLPRPGGGTYCPAAGPFRSPAICDDAAATGLPVGIIAVRKENAGNKGTRDCLKRARSTLAPVIEDFIDILEAWQLPGRG